jgi:Mce-associated membrane protein
VTRPVQIALGAVAAALLVLAGGELWYLGNEPAAATEERPVVLGDLATQAVVDAAAQDLTEIVSTSYHNYDEQVDQATTLMTPEYAEAYRTTAADLKAAFVDARQETAAEVVLSGVVSATPKRVEALLFLDQQVSRDGGATVRVPYRTLVTMTHTAHGWLVSGIETR